jgi:hypothetical protein
MISPFLIWILVFYVYETLKRFASPLMSGLHTLLTADPGKLPQQLFLFPV